VRPLRASLNSSEATVCGLARREVSMVKILFVGDITGRPGRWVTSQLLWGLKRVHDIDFVVANVENAAGGYGTTAEICQKIYSYGADVLTTGNHIWDRKDQWHILDEDPYLLRPANYPPSAPGVGTAIKTTASGIEIGVLNLQGRVYMKEIDCPFRSADHWVEILKESTNVVLVDMHAEATSEKQALGYYLDGRVTAVIGTHTHVQTADEKILKKGTAYITDVGMTGPHESVLWVKPEDAIARFLSQIPHRFRMAEGDPRLSAVIIAVDEKTGKAEKIERLQLAYDGSVTAREFLGLPPRELDLQTAPEFEDLRKDET